MIRIRKAVQTHRKSHVCDFVLLFIAWGYLRSPMVCVDANPIDLTASPPFGTPWFMGGSQYKFHQDSKLVKWKPMHPQIILTQFPEERISEVGDVVVKKFEWMSDGKNKCPASEYSNGNWCKGVECAHRSVSCLAGTGDFRIGLYDSKSDTNNTGQITEDGFANSTKYGGMCKQLQSAPFRLFRGYHYRIYPHISSTAEKYVHEKTGGHVPCGFYFKGASKAMYGKKRINQEGNGCFELGLGQWSTLVLSINRTSETSMVLGMEMNGHAFYTTHHWILGSGNDTYIPNHIDTVAIMYPNGRRYYYVEWAMPGSNPPPAHPSEDEEEDDYDYKNLMYANADEIDQETLISEWRSEKRRAWMLSPFGGVDRLFAINLFGKGSENVPIFIGFGIFNVVMLFMAYHFAN